MFTAQDVYSTAMSFMDEKSVNGIAIPDSEQLDYRMKAIDLINTSIEEISETINVNISKKYSRRYFPNTIEKVTGFEGAVHEIKDIEYLANNKSTSYYFEVDGDATVRIEIYNPVLESWRTAKTITVEGVNGEYKSFKGILENLPEDGELTRIIFSGEYYYRIGNVALYNKRVKEEVDIPEFKEWIEVEFENKVVSIDSISDLNRKPIGESNYRIEDNQTKVYLHYEYEDTIIINYSGFQNSLVSFDDVIHFDDRWKPILSYYLAAHLLIGDGEDTAQYFVTKYEEAFNKATESVESDIVELDNFWSFTY